MRVVGRTSWVLVLIVLGALAGAGGVTAGPERPSLDKAELQMALDRLVALGAPGAIALARDGNQTIRLTSGYGILKRRVPVHATDRFRVGSVTKAFVATIVLQLAREGKVALEDTVERWLPGVIPNGRAITVRHLLNMTSGLADYLSDDSRVSQGLLKDPKAHWTPRQLIGFATAHKPHYAPGAGWSYCNTCYVALGLIVQKATGNSIATELRNRIFRPVGLHSTSFATGPRISGTHMHGYELIGRPPPRDVSVLDQSWAWTAGAIVSTADDVARFYRALLGGRLLRAAQLRAMLTPAGSARAARYGFGTIKLPFPCGAAWGHDGGTPGYRTWALNSKDGQRQIVVLANLGEESLSKKATNALEHVLAVGYCG